MNKSVISAKPEFRKDEKFVNTGAANEAQKKRLEEANVEFRAFFHQKRFDVAQEWLKKEVNISLPIKPRIGLGEETKTKLKQKRKYCWRGYIEKRDFLKVLEEFEFKKIPTETVIELITIMGLLHKTY